MEGVLSSVDQTAAELMKDLSKNKLKRLDPETFVNNRLISKVNVMNNTEVSSYIRQDIQYKLYYE